jgi:hypothetical protein
MHRGSHAFTLVELMIGLTLAVCLAVAVAPVWVSLERGGADDADETIWFLQSRVALARFERDLRLSGAARCPFVVETSVLQATMSQMVLLERGVDGSPPVIVEWEIVKGSLMRRTGMCPQTRPTVFNHSIYIDSKTMIENLRSGSRFQYLARGKAVAVPASPSNVTSITAVVLELVGGISGAPGEVRVSTTARVGM